MKEKHAKGMLAGMSFSPEAILPGWEGHAPARSAHQVPCPPGAHAKVRRQMIKKTDMDTGGISDGAES